MGINTLMTTVVTLETNDCQFAESDRLAAYPTVRVRLDDIEGQNGHDIVSLVSMLNEP